VRSVAVTGTEFCEHHTSVAAELLVRYHGEI
jgi:hypothetical protein